MLTTNQDKIGQAAFERLVEAGAVESVAVVGQPGGWSVVVRYGTVERALAAKRNHVRLFRKLESLVDYLRGLGLETFQVDASGFDPGARSAERRSIAASERMRQVHEAAAHDTWLREQVRASLDDPRPSVPHDQAREHMAGQRAELRKRLAAEIKT